MQFDLFSLTGLSEQEVTDVLLQNPRAYMAFKGAIAEQHLFKILKQFEEKAFFSSIRAAESDFDKDFYVNHKGKEFSIECKNVEVLKTSKKAAKIDYFNFLIDENFVSKNEMLEKIHFILNQQTADEQHNILPGLLDDDAFNRHFGSLKDYFDTFKVPMLDELSKQLDQRYRESGMYRYLFSKSRINENIDDSFLARFGDENLSIDFQRTRNSTDDEEKQTKNRLYKVGEVDIVAVCLFARTMEWEFLYAKAENLNKSEDHEGCYANSVIISNDTIWHSDITKLF